MMSQSNDIWIFERSDVVSRCGTVTSRTIGRLKMFESMWEFNSGDIISRIGFVSKWVVLGRKETELESDESRRYVYKIREIVDEFDNPHFVGRTRYFFRTPVNRQFVKVGVWDFESEKGIDNG